MGELWHDVCERIDDSDLDAVADLLAGLAAKDRTALLPLLDAHTPTQAVAEPVVLAPEPQVGPGDMVLRAHAGAAPVRPEPPRVAVLLDEATVRLREHERRNARNSQYWRMLAEGVARRTNQERHLAYSLAVIACVGPVADAVKRLHAPWTPTGRPLLVAAALPGLLRVRGTDWCATLGRGLLRRIRSRDTADLWPFTEALLRAVGAAPPEEPTAVARYVSMPRPGVLAEFLAADPWLDTLLPHLFDEDLVAVALGGATDWQPALLGLAATGRVPRDTLIAGCLRRLRTGRPGLLQPFLTLFRGLDPAPAELAPHRQALTGLLAAPLSTVAELAHTSLQRVHRASALDAATLTEITAGMLSRPEKKLVRAHQTWLRQLPLDDLVEGLVAGLHHPAAELAARTLDLLVPRLPHLPATARDRLRDELPALDGDVARRLAALLGSAPPAPVPVAPLLATLPAQLPPPLDLGALAGELKTALHKGDDDPVRHELMLDGLLRAAHGDRAAAARVLAPLLPAWAGALPDLIAAVAGLAAPPRYDDEHERRYDTPLGVFVRRRTVELTALVAAGPPPALLATPATVAGHVDPDRVLGLLRQAERDGWQPGPADLTQALLRLPRSVDEAVHAAAARLTSPAGRRFADRLAAGAEPRAWIEDVPAQQYSSGRRIAMLDPAGLPDVFADPRTAAERARAWHQPALALWPMVAPSHREAAAAHIQPHIVTPNGNPGTVFLDGLAAADGPPGPAMSLILAYTLASAREPVRLATADALVTLAARPDWDSTGTGAELGALASADRIVLQRTVQPLTEALRAGAHTAVWQVTSAALPALLAADPRPGLADIIALAADAAPHVPRTAGAHQASGAAGAAGAAGADRAVRVAGAGGAPLLAGIAALAARPGRTRMVDAARRLAAAISPA